MKNISFGAKLIIEDANMTPYKKEKYEQLTSAFRNKTAYDSTHTVRLVRVNDLYGFDKFILEKNNKEKDVLSVEGLGDIENQDTSSIVDKLSDILMVAKLRASYNKIIESKNKEIRKLQLDKKQAEQDKTEITQTNISKDITLKDFYTTI